MIPSLHMSSHLAALHQQDLRTKAAQQQRAGSIVPVGGRGHEERIAPMQALKTYVILLLLNPRAAVVAATALALVATALLGPEGADARWGCIGGRR